MPAGLPEWRLTRPKLYGSQSTAADRDGYYIRAATAEDAGKIMAKRHPGERFTLQPWKDGNRTPVANQAVCGMWPPVLG